MKKRLACILMIVTVFSVFSGVANAEWDFEYPYPELADYVVTSKDKKYCYIESENIKFEKNVKNGAYIVEYIGDKKDVVIPEKIDNKTVIGMGARYTWDESRMVFEAVPDSVTLPKTLKYIAALENKDSKKWVFKNLGEFETEKSEYSDDDYFPSFKSPKSIKIADGNENFRIVGNALYSKDLKKLYKYFGTDTKKVGIEPQAKKICRYAFGCADCDSVTLPDGLEYIAPNGFWHSNIKIVEFPDSLKVIEQGAFNGCKNLKDVKFGNGYLVIYPYAFKDCKLIEELHFTKGINFSYLRTDGTHGTASPFSGCTGIKKIVCDNGIIPKGNVFGECEIVVDYTIPYAPVITRLVSSNPGCATLEYKGVPGVKEYEIEASTDGGNTFKVLKKQSPAFNGYLHFTKLKCGVRYIFRVRGVRVVDGEKVYGEYSEEKAINIFLSSLYKTKVKGIKGGMRINYKKVKNSQGVEIKYRKISGKKSGWKVKYFKSDKSCKKTLKLKKGTYKVKFRAKAKVGGEYVYGYYSYIQKVKVK